MLLNLEGISENGMWPAKSGDRQSDDPWGPERWCVVSSVSCRDCGAHLASGPSLVGRLLRRPISIPDVCAECGSENPLSGRLTGPETGASGFEWQLSLPEDTPGWAATAAASAREAQFTWVVDGKADVAVTLAFHPVGVDVPAPSVEEREDQPDVQDGVIPFPTVVPAETKAADESPVKRPDSEPPGGPVGWLFSSWDEAMAALQQIAGDLVQTDSLTADDIVPVVEWLLRYGDHCVVWPGSVIFDCLHELSASGQVPSESDLADLLQLMRDIQDSTDLKGRPAESILDDGRVYVSDCSFLFTGRFTVGPRKQLEDRVLEMGGSVEKKAVMGLDYLVVGGLGNKNWRFGRVGRKIAQVIENRREIVRGRTIGRTWTRIVSEAQLVAGLELE